jgi:adenylate cyclase
MERAALVPNGALRRVAAFVHCDIVGYSRMVGQDDTGTHARLGQLRRTLIDPALERYGGRIINTAGDSLMIEFGNVRSAVRFAAEIQTHMPELDNDVHRINVSAFAWRQCR